MVLGEKMTKKNELLKYLKACKEEVSKWPSWKRNIALTHNERQFGRYELNRLKKIVEQQCEQLEQNVIDNEVLDEGYTKIARERDECKFALEVSQHKLIACNQEIKELMDEKKALTREIKHMKILVGDREELRKVIANQDHPLAKEFGMRVKLYLNTMIENYSSRGLFVEAAALANFQIILDTLILPGSISDKLQR